MSRKEEGPVQRHHLTDEQWQKFDRLMTLMTRLTKKLIGSRADVKTEEEQR